MSDQVKHIFCTGGANASYEALLDEAAGNITLTEAGRTFLYMYASIKFVTFYVLLLFSKQPLHAWH